MDTGACYGIKKCAEAVFRRGNDQWRKTGCFGGGNGSIRPKQDMRSTNFLDANRQIILTQTSHGKGKERNKRVDRLTELN